MPKFKVLQNNVFGEGYMAGDIIEMDTHAAELRLKLGEIELVDSVPVEKPKRGRPRKE